MNPIEDRDRVRTQLNVNFVVEAGAGTGKTTLLIERLCFALLAQQIAAARLVALTFTEKAAAEITTRLIFELQAVLQLVRCQKQKMEEYLTQNQVEEKDYTQLLLQLLPPAQNERQKRTREIVVMLEQHFQIALKDILTRGELALAQLERSQIGTIHSFCADILRAYPLEAGLTPNAEIDKGTRAQRIFDTQWNHFLDIQLGENAPHAEIWKEVLARVSLADLYNCAREMCSGKAEKYDFFARKEQLAQEFLLRAQKAQQLANQFEKGQKKPRVIEKALQQAARRFTQAHAWLTANTLPPEEEETIKINSVPKDWDKIAAEEAKSLCAFAEQADPFIQTWILKAYGLLQELVEQVRARYATEGILSFDDLIVKTRDLLQHNLLVRRLVQEKYDALYVDEFQDTDPVQGEILLYLAEQKGNGSATWQEVKLEPGKLFVVGDPKQSIYHFRGADITAYQLFTNLILQQGGQKAYLRQNFRSEPEIIALANEVGAQVMHEKPGFQSAYEAIFTNKSTTDHSAAEMALVCSSEQEQALADDFRHNQAEIVARWINENVGKMRLKDGQLLQYKDIAILSRAATTLWPYTDALRRAGIAFSIEEDKDFYKRQEISDFLNLLRVLNDPQDKISLVGLMRSPLGSLTDEEVYQAAKHSELDFRFPASHEKLERLFVLLRKFNQRVGREPLAHLLRSLLQESLLMEACALAYEGEQSVDNLQHIVELAEGYCLSNPVTLGQFLARIQDLMEQELGGLTTLSKEDNSNSVNVMTIHKSKGLEFPVVILVDISKRDTQNAAKRSAHLYSWKYDLHGFRIGRYADMNLAWLEEEQKEHNRCEEVRVLYVALTRAKEKLLLVGNLTADDASMAGMFKHAGIFPSEEQAQESLLEGNAFQVGQCSLNVHLIKYQDPKQFIYKFRAPLREQKSSWDLASWRRGFDQRIKQYEAYKSIKLPTTPSDLVQQAQPDDKEAMQLGSILHAALARKSQFTHMSIEGVLASVIPSADATLYEKAYPVLKTFYTSDVWQQLSQMKLLGAEIPFSLYNGQDVINGVIDLLLQDKEENVWVIDYKTDHIVSGAENQAAQKYKPQLEIYAQAVRQLYPQKQVHAAVVFVRSGVLVQL